MVFNVSPQIFATSGDHWMARNIILYKTHGSSDVANTWLCVNPNKLDVIPLCTLNPMYRTAKFI